MILGLIRVAADVSAVVEGWPRRALPFRVGEPWERFSTREIGLSGTSATERTLALLNALFLLLEACRAESVKSLVALAFIHPAGTAANFILAMFFHMTTPKAFVAL